MYKSFHKTFFTNHSPQINSRAMITEMDKSIPKYRMPFIAHGLNRGLWV